MDTSIIIIIEFAILMVAVSLSKKQTKQAVAQLSNSNREKMRGLMGSGINQLIPILIMIIVFFMVKSVFPEDQKGLTYGFAAVLVLYLIINGILLFRKLKRAGLPKSFTKAYLQGTMIMYIGAAIFCFLAVTNPL